MRQLDEIQARFERADKAQDAYLEGRSVITAMVRSVACTGDVPKLVAALRSIEELLAYWGTLADGDRYYAETVRARIRDALE